jgi:hypothetical protein
MQKILSHYHNELKPNLLKNYLINVNKVRFEVFTAVTMKNGVFWVVTPCGSCKNPEDTILREQGGLFLTKYVAEASHPYPERKDVSVHGQDGYFPLRHFSVCPQKSWFLTIPCLAFFLLLATWTDCYFFSSLLLSYIT